MTDLLQVLYSRSSNQWKVIQISAT